MFPVPYRMGDRLAIVSYSSSALKFYVRANVKQPKRRAETYQTSVHTTNSDRTIAKTADTPLLPGNRGWIHGLQIIGSPDVPPKRGVTYVIIQLIRDVAMQNLHTGYWTDTSANALNQFEISTDGQGRVFRQGIGAADTAGDTAVNQALNAVNALRRLNAIVMLYNCSSDVDTRVVQFLIRRPFGDLPTGFTNVAVEIAYESPSVTLTANEEGMIYLGENGHGYQATNDNGTVAVSDNTTVPNILPLTILEGESATQLRTNITDGHANDRYSIFGLTEEWIEV